MPARSGVSAVLCVSSVLFVAGCGSEVEPTAPSFNSRQSHAASVPDRSPSLAGSAAPSGGFYPLRSGNHWDYHRSSIVEVRPFSGTASRIEYSSTIATDQTCEEIVSGRTYLMERGVESGRPYAEWIRFRQDRNGLYEADVAVTDPPACEGPPPPPEAAMVAHSIDADDDDETPAFDLVAGMPADQRGAWLSALERNRTRLEEMRAALGLGPHPHRRGVGSPPPGELLRLSYPLHPGAAWVVRPDPDFTARVEGVDALHTPAGTLVGYRIRIHPPGLTEREHAFVWYGRQGFLKLDVHLESPARDEAGREYGTVLSDDRQTLTSLALVDARSGPAALGHVGRRVTNE